MSFFSTLQEHLTLSNTRGWLLVKLEHVGIHGKILSEFLSNQRQHVVIDGQCSQRSSVSLGVPQGSILGPLLFLIYVGDRVLSNCKLFADDCVIYRDLNSHADAELLQNDLNHILMWSRIWALPLHEL